MLVQDRVLILHGWGGSDAPHWQAELGSEIAKNYGCVYFPLLDNCHFPSKNRWVKQVREILENFQPTTVVCHSLANTLWLWLCEEGLDEVERLYMVSPPSVKTKEETIKTFFPPPMPQRLYAKEVEVIVSDDDPWVSVEEVNEFAKKFGAKLEVLKGAGHINAESGFGKWEAMEHRVLKKSTQ